MADWRQEKARTRTRTSADDRRALRETVAENRTARLSSRATGAEQGNPETAVGNVPLEAPTGKPRPAEASPPRLDRVDGDDIPY